MLKNRLKNKFQSIDSLLLADYIPHAQQIITKCESELVIATYDYEDLYNDDSLIVMPKRLCLMSNSINEILSCDLIHDHNKCKQKSSILSLKRQILKKNRKKCLKRHIISLISKVTRESCVEKKTSISENDLVSRNIVDTLLDEIIRSIELNFEILKNLKQVEQHEFKDDTNEFATHFVCDRNESFEFLKEIEQSCDLKLSRAKLHTLDYQLGAYHETSLITVKSFFNKMCNNYSSLNEIIMRSKSCNNLIELKRNKPLVKKTQSEKSIQHMPLCTFEMYQYQSETNNQNNEEMYCESEKYFSNSTLDLMSLTREAESTSLDHLYTHESEHEQGESGEMRASDDDNDEKYALFEQVCDALLTLDDNLTSESPLNEQHGLPDQSEIEIVDKLEETNDEQSIPKQTKTIEFKTKDGLVIEMKVNFTQINNNLLKNESTKSNNELKFTFEIDLSQYPTIRSHNLTHESNKSTTEIEFCCMYDEELKNIELIDGSNDKMTSQNDLVLEQEAQNEFQNEEINDAVDRKPRPSYLIQKNSHIFGGCDEDEADDEFFLSSGAVYQSWPYIYEPGFTLVPLIEEDEIIRMLSKSDYYLYNGYSNKAEINDSEGDLNYSLNELPTYSLNNYELNLIHTIESAEKKRKRKRRHKSIISLNSRGSSVSSTFDVNDDGENDDYFTDFDSESETESLRAYKQRHAKGFTNFEHLNTTSISRFIRNFCSNVSLKCKARNNQFQSSSSMHKTRENDEFSSNKISSVDKNMQFFSERYLNTINHFPFASTNLLF